MSIPTGTYRIYTRTLGVAAAAAAAADEQREAGGDDVELAHLLPRRAPRLLQLPLRLPPAPLPHAGVAVSWFKLQFFRRARNFIYPRILEARDGNCSRAGGVWPVWLQPDRSMRWSGPRATIVCCSACLWC